MTHFDAAHYIDPFINDIERERENLLLTIIFTLELSRPAARFFFGSKISVVGNPD